MIRNYFFPLIITIIVIVAIWLSLYKEPILSSGTGKIALPPDSGRKMSLSQTRDNDHNFQNIKNPISTTEHVTFETIKNQRQGQENFILNDEKDMGFKDTPPKNNWPSNENDNNLSIDSHNNFQDLLARVNEAEHAGNRDEAFDILLTLKDTATDEDLQTILKKMYDYADKGGNEIIMQVFFTSQDLSEGQKFRMLTYINPDYPLNQQNVNLLQQEFDQIKNYELRRTIASTLAMTGGESGVKWLTRKADNAADYTEWTMLIDDLSLTQSEDALQYLHEALNTLAEASPEYEVHREKLREAIHNFNEK